MIKEDKKVDFLTTGRQTSEEGFARISEWIKRDKQKQSTRKRSEQSARKKDLTQQRALRKVGGK